MLTFPRPQTPWESSCSVDGQSSSRWGLICSFHIIPSVHHQDLFKTLLQRKKNRSYWKPRNLISLIEAPSDLSTLNANIIYIRECIPRFPSTCSADGNPHGHLDHVSDVLKENKVYGSEFKIHFHLIFPLQINKCGWTFSTHPQSCRHLFILEAVKSISSYFGHLGRNIVFILSVKRHSVSKMNPDK